jgi:hypothetical protein
VHGRERWSRAPATAVFCGTSGCLEGVDMQLSIEQRVNRQLPFLKPMFNYWKRNSVRRYSRFDNIYYCCTQKTASQWIRKILENSLTYRYTGLGVSRYNALGLKEAAINQPFPLRTIVTTLYIDYPTYRSIPKPRSHEAFFVLRDPRDCVVSWYYSMKNTHPTDSHPIISQTRSALQTLDKQAGMRYVIDQFENLGFFAAQRSWTGKEVRLFRYEDLAEDSIAFVKALFHHLEIDMPERQIVRMCDTLSFRNRTGRPQGLEDVHHHLRKGVAGDWVANFDATTLDHFYARTGDLVSDLGYQKN